MIRNDPNILRWGHTTKGTFTIKEAYDLQAGKSKIDKASYGKKCGREDGGLRYLTSFGWFRKDRSYPRINYRKGASKAHSYDGSSIRTEKILSIYLTYAHLLNNNGGNCNEYLKGRIKITTPLRKQSSLGGETYSQAQ